MATTNRYIVVGRATGAERWEVHDTAPELHEDSALPPGVCLYVCSARSPHTANHLAELMNSHGLDDSK